MFKIPEIKSVKSLFVINKDAYTNKQSGELRCSVQVLVPVGNDRPNKKGYAVAQYSAEPAVYDALDLDNGPIMAQFETEPRESRNGFGNTTNSDHLLRVIPEAAAKPSQTAPAASAAGQKVSS
ncbi:hypothetical protein KQ940_13235 [Marinobacterium sp. D7]|uniref:hypothetical protein n=1 Tax=Marinobacterium ramblicola TaxID=2849041 RepID=UPI001C2D6926|nr:hypothetical protein [Marinobacterium ramblicola]MBV1789015.1 hypothetical protein [Marinobacterium ramblicola]